jgi:hypothetical protein
MDGVKSHGSNGVEGRRCRVEGINGWYGAESPVGQVLHPNEGHEIYIRFILACFGEVFAAGSEMCAPVEDGALSKVRA